MKPAQIVFAAFAATAAVAFPAEAALRMDAPGHVLVEGESATIRGGTPGAAWRVLDWRGRPLGIQGEWDADGAARIPAMRTGYCRLESGGLETTFAVVGERRADSVGSDPFYGVDAALSWVSRKGAFECPWNGGDSFKTVANLVRLSGAGHVRERLRWAKVEPEPGCFDWGRYMRNARMQRENGLRISGMFHDCPPWAGKLEKLPGDMEALYAFCKRAAGDFGDCMEDWEFWNEEDAGFAQEPVWDYAAALKAASLGFRAGRPGTVVLNGALTHLAPYGPYARALFANDAAKYTDVLNLHTYLTIVRYPGEFAKIRAFMEDAGIGGRAIWMTECGSYMEGRGGRPSIRKGILAHSPEQELFFAEFYPKAQIALRMEGVARSYHFVFGAFNVIDGKKDQGVLRRDGTVKPVFSSIATMIRETENGRLAGELECPAGQKAFLFEMPDGTQTVAFWSVSLVEINTGRGIGDMSDETASSVSIPAPDGEYAVSDLCGAKSRVVSRGGTLELAATRFPAYVSGLKGLKAAKAARAPGRIEKYVPGDDEDLSIVMRAELDKNDFTVAKDKASAIAKGGGGRVRIEIWNLEDRAKNGRLEIAGAAVEGLPAEIALAPRGGGPAIAECSLAPAPGADGNAMLEISGVFDGRRTSRLSVPIVWNRGE